MFSFSLSSVQCPLFGQHFSWPQKLHNSQIMCSLNPTQEFLTINDILYTKNFTKIFT